MLFWSITWLANLDLLLFTRRLPRFARSHSPTASLRSAYGSFGRGPAFGRSLERIYVDLSALADLLTVGYGLYSCFVLLTARGRSALRASLPLASARAFGARYGSLDLICFVN